MVALSHTSYHIKVGIIDICTGTTVNAIAPGFVETEWQKDKPQEIRENIYKKTAIKRFASIDEIADAVRFCIRNSFVNGSVIEISGGYSFK